PTTREQHSEEEPTNTDTRASAMVEVTAQSGRKSRNRDRATDTSAASASASAPSATVVSMIIAELPKTVSHRKVKPTGTNRTAVTNSRTVRPREMRAMNMPTKGDQEIHQAQ